MTTLIAPFSLSTPDKITRSANNLGVREMLRSPAVLVALILGSTLIALGLLGSIVWLTMSDRGTEAIFTLISFFITPVLGALWYRLASVDNRLNGHQTRMMDAVLKDKENPPAS